MSEGEDPIVARVLEAQRQGKVIAFSLESPDNEYPEIIWQIFGLIDSNEMVVIAKCGELQLGICEESWLLHPPMADRMFGIDVADQELANQLSMQLWEKRGNELSKAALSVRAQQPKT